MPVVRWVQQIACEHVGRYFLVLHDGRVLLCCVLTDPEKYPDGILGNVEKEGVMGVWNGKIHMEFFDEL